MATSPDRVRRGLRVLTSAAESDLQQVAARAAGRSLTVLRPALFAAAPLIVAEYVDGSAALALDWYTEIREEADPPHPYRAEPVAAVAEDEIAGMVARATEPLRDLSSFDGDLAPVLSLVSGGIQHQVAAGFRDTVTSNTARDRDAVGWQRFASAGGCRFCRMLAGRGAVYTEATVRFAAHDHCHCVTGPSYDPDAPKATVMQHVASQASRTPAQQKALRDYLNTNFPDAPG